MNALLTKSLLLLTALLGGCNAYQRDEALVARTARGDFGEARLSAQQRVTTDPGDRNFMLDRYKALIVTLAEGLPDVAAVHADRVYEMLRTQGLNEDNTVPSFFFGEGGVRVWKGEPFEQAMGYTYVAIYEGLRGDWGNVRAAANNSLFLLRDFSGALQGAGGDQLSQRERLIETAQRNEQSGRSANHPDTLPVDYRPVASDFELGYALKALAARARGDTAELNEAVTQLSQVAPHLRSLAQRIQSAPFNTAIIVDAGLGPRKIATGPDGVIASFAEVSRSDAEPLVVRVGNDEGGFPVLTDLNRLAGDLKWNNLEDLRVAKSTVGSVLMIGGVATAAASRDRTTQLAGLGAAVAGALLKATSSADTRHCEVLPQRVYIALVSIPDSGTGALVELSIRNRGGAMLRLPAVPAPATGQIALRYVRLPESSAAWATSGQLRYTADGMSPGACLPYILGGTDVRTPNPQVMQDYYAGGLPRDLTSEDLLAIYREEGIKVVALNPSAPFGRHILEGGDALYSPQPCTTGFVRLFCQDHPAYRPRSPRLQELTRRLGAGASGSRTLRSP